MDPTSLAADYLVMIDKWCVVTRKMKANKPGVPPTRAYDMYRIKAIVEVAKDDLPKTEYVALLTSLQVIYGKKGAKSFEDRLPATAWSMYYAKCVLCASTKRRHSFGGRCTGCANATMELSKRTESLLPSRSANKTTGDT